MNEIRANAHNEIILYLWKANMDLQFILDPYACVVYVVSYTGKSQRGMSKLLKDALLHKKAGYATIKERLRGIAYKFQSCSEVSAQEVAYHLLSLPLSQCSRANVYINTNPYKQRVRILKSQPILKDMDLVSEDILQPGLIEHYIQRPNELEDVCLPEFAAWYEYQSKKRIGKIQNEFQENTTDKEGGSSDKNPKLLALKYSGYIRLRRQAKIIRFRRYNIIQDETNYYREQLMLYFAWRNELNDSENIDLKPIYESNLIMIAQNKSMFENKQQSSIDEAFSALENIDADDINFDGIAIEGTVNNEGIEIIEYPEYHIDNPGSGN